MSLLILLEGCVAEKPNIAQTEQAQADFGQQQIIKNQPIPDMNGYSYERWLAFKMIEIRNKSVKVAYAYQFVPTANGLQTVFICETLGYPIPYAVQTTNPQRIEWIARGGNYSLVTLDNPEPNMLYMPASADATWIPCVFDGKIFPFYYEEKVETFPLELDKPDRVLSFKLKSGKTNQFEGLSVEDYKKAMDEAMRKYEAELRKLSEMPKK